MFKQLAVIIPTRNRSDLAIRSARSVIASQNDLAIRILISDNSTEANHSAAIDRFVESRPHGNLTLLRPQRPLPMTAHWEWAITEALQTAGASHFAFLTDRMSFRPGEVRSLIEIARHYPNDVISYTLDRIDDFSTPVRYRPLPRTGRLFRIESTLLLSLSSRMTFFSCLPRMLNCVVPLEHLEQSKLRFGSIFSSVSPDFCFCYRCLALNDSILYFDKSVLLNYALGKSNGASIARGIPSKDSMDVLSTIKVSDLNSYTNLPEVITVGNAIVNEYNFVRRESSSAKFPPISARKYMDFLAAEVSDFLGLERRLAGLCYLRREGWRPSTEFRVSRIKAAAISAIVWILEYRFHSLEEAIDYANNRPPHKSIFSSFLARRYRSVQVPLPIDDA